MKRKKQLVSLLIMFMTLASVFGILTQIVFTISVSPAFVECEKVSDENLFIERMAERFKENSLMDDEHAISFNGSLPSSDPNDYMLIYCNFEVKNRSFLDRYSINGTLKNASNYEANILFVCDANAAFTQSVGRKDQNVARIILSVYIGNLNETQIRDLVNGIEVSVKAYGEYFGIRSKDISFSTCEDISFETSSY